MSISKCQRGCRTRNGGRSHADYRGGHGHFHLAAIAVVAAASDLVKDLVKEKKQMV